MLTQFLHDETGATAIEYALIGVLVCVAIINGLTILGNTLDTTFSSVSSSVDSTGS